MHMTQEEAFNALSKSSIVKENINKSTVQVTVYVTDNKTKMPTKPVLPFVPISPSVNPTTESTNGESRPEQIDLSKIEQE